jgi:chromosome segregation and condensation protein ScpB
MSGDYHLRAVEAALFAAEAPLTPAEIAAAAGEGDVAAALATLAEHYAGRGIELVERGGRWHFQTAPDLAHILRRERREPRPLSRAAVETLAIIAYHEPASRAEIEAIRASPISAWEAGATCPASTICALPACSIRSMPRSPRWRSARRKWKVKAWRTR